MDTPTEREPIALGDEGERRFGELVKALKAGDGFELIFVVSNNRNVRNEILRRMTESGPLPVCRCGSDPVEYADLARRLMDLGPTLDDRHVFWADPEGPEREVRAAWVAGLRSLNMQRNLVVNACPHAVLLALDDESVKNAPKIAPDWWSVRSHVFRFPDPPTETSSIDPFRRSIDDWPLSHELRDPEYYRKLAENYAGADGKKEVIARATLHALEADSALLRGDLDRALGILRNDILPSLADVNAEFEMAVTRGKIADILFRQGNWDEALRIRREDELPVYERTGHAEVQAVSKMRIADVLLAKGELDEALRTLREEVLHIFESHGEVRLYAVTLGRIAEIIAARGDLEEAMRIRRDHELPVYERLGDVRERAITMGKISDILQARGDLDEALRIRREEELPVYARLGDVRERAVTMGKIADILHARGELGEALRIRKEEELPVYERLGDVRSRAVTMGKIADILHVRGDFDEALRIRREEELPVYERLGDVLSRAMTMGKIADILRARGELDEALRIRKEEELPIYERQGDMRERAICKANIALTLAAKDKERYKSESKRLLLEAADDARKLRIPEEKIILDLIRRFGLDS